MKNYLFLIRSYNDIDHLTPIIDYLNKHRLAFIHLYTSVPYGLIYPNENLDYLEKKYNIKPEYLLNPHYNFIILLLESTYVKLKNYKTNKLLPIIVEKIINKLIYLIRRILIMLQVYFLSSNIEKLIKEIKPDIVCYDWTDPSRFPLSIITINAKKMNIPIIGLPHSVIVYEKFDIDYDTIQKKEIERQKNGLSFDWQITYGELGKKHIVNEGYPENKVSRFFTF